MNVDFNTSKPLQYLVYLLLFITGQSLSMWGQYVTLPFKNLTYWQAFSMAIPFAWADWFFMTFAIDIGHRYKLVTPTQDTFLLIILQFSLVLLINQFYLKQKVYRSDILAFGILLVGYFISFFHLVSKAFNIPIPEQHTTEETNASKKVKKYTGYKKSKTKAKENKENKENKDKKKNKRVKFTENS
jgi:hypothetical protein